MKNFALSFSFSLFALFSFSGGCVHHLDIAYSETEIGKKVRLTFAVDMTQPSPHCEALSRCQSFQWYKHDGVNFVLIPGATGNYYETYEPGVYKLVACRSVEGGVTVVDEGDVYKNEIITEPLITNFSVFPNPSSKEEIRLLIPSNPISLESNTFKLELYNTLGNSILTESNLPFGIHSMVLDMQGKGAGIYLLKITSGEEVKILKVMVK